MVNIFPAEVIDTNMSYRPMMDSDGNEYAHGAIRFRARPGAPGATPIINTAYPISANDIEIPIVGEHVLVVSATSDKSDSFSRRTRFYYIKNINIHDDININALPGINSYKPSETSGRRYNSSGIRNASATINDSTVRANTRTHTIRTVNFLQPYEGDRILQSRAGASIRFTTSVIGDLSTYSRLAPWRGKISGDPALIFSVGRNTESQYYNIENINTDKSSFYILSNQQVPINTRPFYNTIVPASTYMGAQVIINSDRLIFNSKRDSILLSASRTVGISTARWKVDSDKFFTIVEKIVEELANLASGKAQFQTAQGPTTIATNVAQIQKLLIELKTMKQ